MHGRHACEHGSGDCGSVQVTAACIVTQMYYLNKALDTFNTAIVTPVYYVMFTTCTLVVSCVLFQPRQAGVAVVSELCGFAVIVAGTFLLHTTKDLDVGSPTAAVALGLRGASAAGAVAAAAEMEEGGGPARDEAAVLLRPATARLLERETSTTEGRTR